jgi:short-subunit dehydrogenase/SAM-dependent methyltransferase
MKRLSNTNMKPVLAAGLGVAALAGVLGIVFSRRRRSQMALHWRIQMEAPQERTALVTGASSGIGQAYARRLAERRYNLVLVARREDRLNALAAEYRQSFGVKVEILPADLSTESGIASVEKRITSSGDIDFLVNNAGYDVFGLFAETPIEQTLGLINCLELACVRFTRAALPGMLERRRGAIVNVSSIGAFTPKPKDSTYVACKAYLTMFSESLAMELKGAGVRAQALCPGFTWTEFHDAPEYQVYHIKERIPRWLWMEPDEVVTASLQALGQDRVVCVPGWINRAIVVVARSGLSASLMGILRSFFPKQVASTRILWKSDPLDLLACSHCHGQLELKGDFITGSLVCPACDKTYPILDGIPQFVQPTELTGLNRRFARLYDWFSWIYRPFSKAAFAFIGMTEEAGRGEILNRLEPAGGRVLEVSIGPGVNLPFLVDRPDIREIYGLDISLGQLKRCRKLITDRGWQVGLTLGNGEELPYKDNSFEAVFHIGGINFFNNKQKAIEEMIRVARPGARILICDETEKGARGYELTIPGFKRSFDSPRQPITAPVELVPSAMQEVRLFDVWKGWFYCLEFRKPLIS